MPGHKHPDHPWCKTATGAWRRTSKAVFGIIDKKNSHGRTTIDRHDCVSLKVNNDNLEDIVCWVGARKAKGYGYHELYLTNANGSLRKVADHGLQKYPTLSTRAAAKLRHKQSKSPNLVFVGVMNIVREDGKVNSNRMFKTTGGRYPYFQELMGPWTKYNDVMRAIVADVNMDGLDE